MNKETVNKVKIIQEIDLQMQAKQSNKTVGKVASRQKSERDFKQSMVAEPGETVIFTVVYQALLYRVC